MKKALIISLVTASISSAALAQTIDIIGGPDGSSQTIHHCGFLPTSAKLYTTSPTTIRIIESKLMGLGYLHGVPDGVYGKAEQKAVKRFQNDYGLVADGIVGPLTAQKIGYIGNPSPNVRRCITTADLSFR